MKIYVLQIEVAILFGINFFSAVTLSQGVFHVNLKFSTALDTNKIKIRIDNGKGERRTYLHLREIKLR